MPEYSAMTSQEPAAVWVTLPALHEAIVFLGPSSGTEQKAIKRLRWTLEKCFQWRAEQALNYAPSASCSAPELPSPHHPFTPTPGTHCSKDWGPFREKQLSSLPPPVLVIDLISVYFTVSLICCVNGILIHLPNAQG